MNCKVCGGEINKGHKYRYFYCSSVCRREDRLSKTKCFSRHGLSSGEICELTEGLVSIDMMRAGWKVYKPFDRTHPFDLLVFKDGEYKRVQVKALGKNGKPVLQNNEHDILALVYD